MNSVFIWCSIFLWIAYLKIQIFIDYSQISHHQRINNLTLKTLWWHVLLWTVAIIVPVVQKSSLWIITKLAGVTSAIVYRCHSPCDKYNNNNKKGIHRNEWQGHVKSISCEELPRDGWVGTGIEREGKRKRLPVSPRQCTGNLFRNHSPLWLHCCWRRMLRELISTALHTVSVPPHTPRSQASPHPFHTCGDATRSHFH